MDIYYLTILDYKEGKTKIMKIDYEVEDLDDHVHDTLGHSDYHYMSTEQLIIESP